MKVLLSITALLALSFAQANASFAEGSTASSSAVGESTHSESVPSKSLLDDFYLNYFAIFHGPQAAHIDSPYAVDKGGNMNTHMGMYFDSDMTAAYMITPNVGAGLDIPFLLSPVLGQGATLGDLGVKAFDKKLISTSNFNIYANLILQGATSQASRDRGMTLGVKTTPAVRYTIPSTRFTIGSWTEMKSYSGILATAKDKKTFKLYAAPYVNYQLTSSLSLNLEYEAEAHHDVGMTGANFSMYQSDLEPGIVYMITNKIMFNPYVQIFTGNNVADNVALGAVISATL